jgi:hypothetical protein
MMGLGKRLSYALRCFFALLVSGHIPGDIVKEVSAQIAPTLAPAQAPVVFPSPKLEEPPRESVDRAVQILALLQRDGRLIDFFTEDISPYSDAQIGAAVRELQQSCRQSLERYMKLEPIINSEEGGPVTVQSDVNPAAIKMVGKVIGQPPLRGVLRHRGWRVAHIQLPPLPDGEGRSVIAPAEVEIS